MLAALGLKNQRPAPIEDRGGAPQTKPDATAPLATPPANAPLATPPANAPQTPQPLDVQPRIAPPSAGSRTVTPAPLRAGPAVVTASSRDEALQQPGEAGPGDSAVARPAQAVASSTPLFRESVPRVADLAHADVAQLLWAAATLDRPFQQHAIAQATARPWRSERAYVPVTDPVAGAALHARARQAFAGGRDHEARDLAARAFVANPRDPNLAGRLAFLELRAGPEHAETARQLVLNALAFSGARRSVQVDDWDTLAVASALTGRHADAAGAFLVGLAISGNPERACRVARDAYATYGERLRVAVEALQRRVRLQAGAGVDCAGPTLASNRGWR